MNNVMTNMDSDYKDEDTMAGVYNAWSELTTTWRVGQLKTLFFYYVHVLILTKTFLCAININFATFLFQYH